MPFKLFWSLLGNYLRPQRGKVFLLAIALFTTIGLQLLSPQVVRFFIDSVAANSELRILLRAALLFIGITLGSQVLSVLTTYISQEVAWTATNDLRLDLIGHCFKLDQSFHTGYTPGELVERIDGDTSTLANFFSQFVISILSGAILLTGILILTFLEDWRICLGLGAFALITLLILVRMRTIAIPYWSESRARNAQLFGFLGELFAGLEDVSANGAWPYVMHRFHQLTQRWFPIEVKAIVGFGSLWDSTERQGESCYIDLLNVHPQHQGRSLCRRMLTDMIDYATDNGYRHVTIGTWTSNLKAVPLYKKTGFYWRPDTSVYMENFIPAVRQMPMLADFFQRSDWYRDYDRVLDQSEDEERHPKTGAMKVYVYRWVNGENQTITAIFDRQSQQLCGLETPAFAAYARVDEPKPAMGLTHEVVWEITNYLGQPAEVLFAISADEGIQLDSETKATFTLQANETQTIPSRYLCAPDGPKVENNKWHPKPMPAIRAELQINDREVTLAAGLHYQKPLEISCHPDILTALPCQQQQALVQVQNCLSVPIHGQLNLEVAAGNGPAATPELAWQSQLVTVESESFTSLPLTLQSSASSSCNVRLTATFEHKGQSIQTPHVNLPLLVRPIGGVTALETAEDASDQRILVENDFFRATVVRKGGGVQIHNKAGWVHNMYFSDTVGPSFTPNEFDKKDFALSFTQTGSTVTVITTIVSERFPTLEVRRELVITASPIISVTHQLRHLGDAAVGSHTCQIKAYNRLLNPEATNGLATLPLADRLTSGLASELPAVDKDFPTKPTGVGEQWAAYSVDGQAHGIIWPADVTNHEWRPWGFELYSAEQTVAPQESQTVSSYYLYCGPGDWRDVRRVWQSVTGVQSSPYTLHALDNDLMPEPLPSHRARLLPEPLVTLTNEIEATLHVENVRAVKLNGAIDLDLPNEWEADVNQVTVEELNANHTLTKSIKLTTAQNVGAVTGQLQFLNQVADEATPFALLRLGDARHEIAMTEERIADQQVWRVTNGKMAYAVAPNFHGGIIDWREQDGERNHLYTSFPDEGTFQWMKPWFGGIRPMLTTTDSSWPGKLHEVALTPTIVDAPDRRALPWRGIRLTGMPVEESAQGIEFQLDYLTLPGSNVLKLVFRLINTTSVYRPAGRAWPIWGIYCQVDGDKSHATLHAETPYLGAIQRKRSEQNRDIPVRSWGVVENTESGRALVVVTGERGQKLELSDADKLGGHFWVDHGRDLPPHGEVEMVTYLALAGTVKEAKRYTALAQLR